MYFSGKITNSLLSYIKHLGEDEVSFFDQSDIPPEFLTDPTCWLEAPKVEAFLDSAVQVFADKYPEKNFMESVGQKSSEMKAWGVLDSVLKMMKSPKDIFYHPQRFISYFISPPPPIGNLERQDVQVSFELPISYEEYPRTTEYLRAALEAVPVFMGLQSATVFWRGTRLRINWSQNQSDMLEMQKEIPNLKPEFFQNLLKDLESTQRELESTKKELCVKDQMIQDLQKQSNSQYSVTTDFSKLFQGQIDQSKTCLEQTEHQVQRIRDYVTRMQQMITLLAGFSKNKSKSESMMKKMDWSFIRQESQHVVEDCLLNLSQLKKTFDGQCDFDQMGKEKIDERTDTDLNQVVESVIEKVSPCFSEGITVSPLLFIDRLIPLYPEAFEKALTDVLNFSAQSMDKLGKISVVTRPKGRRAEVEISDDSPGDKIDSSHKVFKSVQSMAQKHKGQFHILSKKGEGSTYLIDLPMA